MRMSTALVNGNEAENRGHKFTLGDTVGSHFQASKMKNISSPSDDFEKLLASKVGEGTEGNNDEVRSMKELLLIHLDYIQQQSEQLAKKNKQIEDIKNENEMLKQRLARMERRVSLQKIRVDKKPGETETPPPPPGSRKRRITTAEAASGKKASLPPPEGGSTTTAKRGKQTERPSTIRIKQEPPDENENEPTINLDDTLTSRVAYHTLMGEKPNCLLKYVRRSKKQKPTHHQIEVPLWRSRSFQSCYQMEGTEDLTDRTFDGRHTKLMVDEKKRKRWDVQRIREQRQVERLRSREGGHKRHKQQYQSLWPQHAEELRFSVTTLVPVSVFGINLPATTIQDFCLPWKEGTRQVPSRRRTKR